MGKTKSIKLQNIILFIIIISFCCLPIWYFDYYINQDGSPHLYNSYIIYEILGGNTNFTDLYSINSYPIPNLSGHWIITLLMLFFQPFIVSKLLITITFAGVIASCYWLRGQTTTSNHFEKILSLFIGTILAFNWLWFLGFYNFIIGFIGYIFAIGLFWKWREELDFNRTLILAVLNILVYLSHLISFGMLLGGIGIICVFAISQDRKKNWLFAAASFIPTIPLLISYKSLSTSGGSVYPNWFYLHNIFSIKDWINHFQAADPFQLISRSAFPVTSLNSGVFSIFSAFLWLFVVIILLLFVTWIKRLQNNFNLKESLPWLLIFGFSVFFWMFAPDDFGNSHGSFLRERVLLCGLVCFIPIFRIEKATWLKITSSIILISLIIFQTFVLWEFSSSTNKVAENYLSAKPFINDTDKLVSIVMIENGCRYKANPLTNLNPLLGIGKNTRIWDNYELGYYLFPVVIKNKDEQQFIFDLRQSNAINVCDKGENVTEKLNNLEELFQQHHNKFTVLLVWNGDERIKPIISEWFEEEPFYIKDKVKLYRHK